VESEGGGDINSTLISPPPSPRARALGENLLQEGVEKGEMTQVFVLLRAKCAATLEAFQFACRLRERERLRLLSREHLLEEETFPPFPPRLQGTTTPARSSSGKKGTRTTPFPPSSSRSADLFPPSLSPLFPHSFFCSISDFSLAFPPLGQNLSILPSPILDICVVLAGMGAKNWLAPEEIHPLRTRRGVSSAELVDAPRISSHMDAASDVSRPASANRRDKLIFRLPFFPFLAVGGERQAEAEAGRGERGRERAERNDRSSRVRRAASGPHLDFFSRESSGAHIQAHTFHFFSFCR